MNRKRPKHEQRLLGRHTQSLAADQLFVVVQGSGWVRGEEAERTVIEPGTAAFWTAEEWHESGSETGMMAIVVEGNALEMSKLLVERS